MPGEACGSANTEHVSTAFMWPTGAAWGRGSGWSAPGLVDTEALIALEICLVKGDGDSEDLRIANILFNNLDVIGELKYALYILSSRIKNKTMEMSFV